MRFHPDAQARVRMLEQMVTRSEKDERSDQPEPPEVAAESNRLESNPSIDHRALPLLAGSTC